MPADMPFDEASALILTYATSIHALKDRAKLKKGETLLVLGAAGGVGLSAVELGKAYGARVIAAVSSPEKLAFVKKHGADDGIVYPPGPFDKAGAKALSDLFKGACGEKGADVIYDPVGGDYSEAALRSIAWEGRFLVVGFPAGIAKLPLNLTLLKSCDVVGVFWGAFARRDPEGQRRQHRRADAALRQGRHQAAGLGALPAGARRRGHRQARLAQGDGQDRRDHGLRAGAMSIVTRWWWIRHAPVPDGGRIYGQSDLACDCSDAEIFRILARELPRDAVWVTSNLVRTKQTAAAILAAPMRRPLRRRRAAGRCRISPSSTWANGRGRSARLSMRRARSARTRCGSRRPTSARRTARASSIWCSAWCRRSSGSTASIAAATSWRSRTAAPSAPRLAHALGLPPQAALGFSIENCSLTRLDHLTANGGAGLWRVVAVNHRPWSRTPAAEHMGHNPVAIDKA